MAVITATTTDMNNIVVVIAVVVAVPISIPIIPIEMTRWLDLMLESGC
jgi:hypothetical protein